MFNTKVCHISAIGVVSCLMAAASGCTIKATLDTTTDGTTEFISSTTGRSWWTEDGLVKNGEHAKAFLHNNYETLLQDMARGQGEYLQSFGTILGIPPVHQHDFDSIVQANYAALAELPDTNFNQFIWRVREEWVFFGPAHL